MNDANKSQMELIIEKFFDNLRTYPEFDEITLAKLRELAASGNLSQYKKIESTIKALSEGENEDN